MPEPEYDEEELDAYGGGDMLDVAPPDLAFNDEQYRRDDLYSQPEFRKYVGRRIDTAPWCRRTKWAYIDFIATFFTRTVLLSHTPSITNVMEHFRLALIALKPTLTPRDVRTPAYGEINAMLEEHFSILISRTVGGAVIRERILQHGQHVTQQVEHIVARPPQKEQPKGILDI